MSMQAYQGSTTRHVDTSWNHFVFRILFPLPTIPYAAFLWFPLPFVVSLSPRKPQLLLQVALSYQYFHSSSALSRNFHGGKRPDKVRLGKLLQCS